MRSLLVATALLASSSLAFAESAPHEFIDDAISMGGILRKFVENPAIIGFISAAAARAVSRRRRAGRPSDRACSSPSDRTSSRKPSQRRIAAPSGS